MAVFFEGRRAQNSEDNIELGDGGGHDLYGVVLHGMAVFLKNRVCIYLYLYIYIYIQLVMVIFYGIEFPDVHEKLALSTK